MSGPLVSVLMTSYNREKYIGVAIESVLASTYQNFELIIVDDGSKDDTVRIAKSYADKDSRVKVYQNLKNLGDYPNRNQAASYSKGKYIKYLDSDDLMYSHCLQVMVDAMEANPLAGFALSSKDDIYKPYPILLSPREAYCEHFEGYGHFDRAPGSSIIRRDAFDHVGGFSGERMIGDTELWFHIGMYYPMVKVVTGLYWSRMHDGQESQTPYARKEYDSLRRMVIDRYFNHPMCPIEDALKKTFLSRMKSKRKLDSIKKIAGKLIR